MNLKRTIIAGSIFIVASLNANHVAMTNDFKVTVENKIINNPGYSWQNMVFKSVSQNDGSVLRELVLEGTDDGFSDRSFACSGIVVCKGQVFFCGYDRYFGVGVPPTIIIDGFIIGTANGVDLMAKVISDEYLRDIATDGDTLIVTGDNGFIATSTDAAGTWTDFNIGEPIKYVCREWKLRCVFNGNRFLWF